MSQFERLNRINSLIQDRLTQVDAGHQLVRSIGDFS